MLTWLVKFPAKRQGSPLQHRYSESAHGLPDGIHWGLGWAKAEAYPALNARTSAIKNIIVVEP